MHKKCGSEVVIDHRDDRTFESDVKEQGDEEFYREQVIPLYSDLYRFLRAFVGDPEAAKDIAQITMERAWRKIHQLKKRDRVKSWLFQIGRNVSSTYASFFLTRSKLCCRIWEYRLLNYDFFCRSIDDAVISGIGSIVPFGLC